MIIIEFVKHQKVRRLRWRQQTRKIMIAKRKKKSDGIA